MISLIIAVAGLFSLVGCGSQPSATPVKVEEGANDSATNTQDLADSNVNLIDDKPMATKTDIQTPSPVNKVSMIEQGEDTEFFDSLSRSQDNDRQNPSFNEFAMSDENDNIKLDIQHTAADYKAAIKKILSEPDADLHYSLEGNCLDHSTSLLQKLRGQGFETVHLAETDGNNKLITMHLKNGQIESASKTHYFLVDRHSQTDAEIIIDPTIYQFVLKKPSEAPQEPIFVGDQNELTNFYSNNIKYIHHDISDPESVNIGQYKPDELVCLIYSVNQCSMNRNDLDR